jgi:hypothetical protein
MTLPRLAPLLEPGIHWELFRGHRVYFAIDHQGERIPLPGVPIGQETYDDVISRLADALDASAPRPRPVPVGRRRGCLARLRDQVRDRLHAPALRLISP